ncbi:MAG TPA: HAMP domain-containing protein, partial [Thermoanaerobaculia bacterium]
MSFPMTLSKKILLSIVLVGAIAIPLLAFFVFASARETLETSTAAAQERAARQLLQAVDRAMYQAQEDIVVIGGNPVLSQAAAAIPAERSDSLLREASRELRELSSLSGFWDSLLVLDRSGAVVVTAGGGAPSPLVEEEERVALQSALRGKTFVSDVSPSPASNAPVMLFAGPVLAVSSGSHEPVGAVLGRLHWPAIAEILKDVPPGAGARLVSSGGVTIAAQGATASRGNPAPALRKPASASEIYRTPAGRRFLQTRVVEQGFRSYSGKRWSIILDAPLERVFAPVRRLARDTALGVAGVLVLLGTVSGLVARRLTRPVRLLTSTARAVAQGDLTSRAEVTTRDEIGALADAFNRMVADLAEEIHERKSAEREMKKR